MQGEEEASKLQSLSCYYRGDMSSAYLCITHLLEECWNVIFLDARDEAREGCRGWVGLADGRVASAVATLGSTALPAASLAHCWTS